MNRKIAIWCRMTDQKGMRLLASQHALFTSPSSLNSILSSAIFSSSISLPSRPTSTMLLYSIPLTIERRLLYSTSVLSLLSYNGGMGPYYYHQ